MRRPVRARLPSALSRGGFPGLQVLGHRVRAVAQAAVGVAEGEGHLGHLRAPPGSCERKRSGTRSRRCRRRAPRRRAGRAPCAWRRGPRSRLPAPRRAGRSSASSGAHLAPAPRGRAGARRRSRARAAAGRARRRAACGASPGAGPSDDLALRPGGEDGLLEEGGHLLVRLLAGRDSRSALPGCACGSRPPASWRAIFQVPLRASAARSRSSREGVGLPVAVLRELRGRGCSSAPRACGRRRGRSRPTAARRCPSLSASSS